jgi:UDP-N-acetylglucosamine 3-dehydrogenase
VTMMRKIKVGVVGCGYIAQQVHIPNYLQNPRSELVAICDTNKDVLEETAKKYGIKYRFEDFRELLDGGLVEAVSVCVPTRLHCKIVTESARKGVHVLCEKPLASNLEEADMMLEAASENAITFSVGFNLRFLQNHVKVREYLNDGRIGKPIFARAQLITTGPYSASKHSYASETERRIGCLFDSGAHVSDLMLWMFGKPSCVSAYLSTHMQGVKVDDSALASIEFESGLLGELSVAWVPIFNYAAMAESKRIQIVGTNGILESDIFGPSFRFYSVDSLSSKIKGKITLTPGRFDPKIPLEALSWSYTREIDDFLQSISSDKTPLVSGEKARDSLKLILAAYESFRSRSVVPLS